MLEYLGDGPDVLHGCTDALGHVDDAGSEWTLQKKKAHSGINDMTQIDHRSALGRWINHHHNHHQARGTREGESTITKPGNSVTLDQNEAANRSLMIGLIPLCRHE